MKRLRSLFSYIRTKRLPSPFFTPAGRSGPEAENRSPLSNGLSEAAAPRRRKDSRFCALTLPPRRGLAACASGRGKMAGGETASTHLAERRDRGVAAVVR